MQSRIRRLERALQSLCNESGAAGARHRQRKWACAAEGEREVRASAALAATRMCSSASLPMCSIMWPKRCSNDSECAINFESTRLRTLQRRARAVNETTVLRLPGSGHSVRCTARVRTWTEHEQWRGGRAARGQSTSNGEEVALRVRTGGLGTTGAHGCTCVRACAGRRAFGFSARRMARESYGASDGFLSFSGRKRS
jgi:hypothetical protein